jgi:hypothetical protein
VEIHGSNKEQAEGKEEGKGGQRKGRKIMAVRWAFVELSLHYINESAYISCSVVSTKFDTPLKGWNITQTGSPS